MKLLLWASLFLPLLAFGQAEPEVLYINGIRLDSVPAQYAVVRMYRVTTGKDLGSFRVLFDYGQLQETGALRTRYENADELSDKYLSTKDGPTYKASSRAVALNLLFANGWRLLQYVPTATADERSAVDERFEIIVEKRD